MVIQVISIGGALMVLVAFTLHQIGRLDYQTYKYQTLNMLGGALLLMAALTSRQAGLILMEGAWTVISAWGVVGVARGTNRG
ncbi:MAG TPA: hypothetical protein VFN10_19890 [Thermoanaerobaculia bacterium]|nr:hypothetical protein [Thermoanaerobaculia bacterium]